MLWACLGKKLLKNHPQVWRYFNILVVCLSALTVLYVTLGNRSGAARALILTPFASFREAKLQPELYRSMLMNVLLCVPLGLSLSEALPGRPSRRNRFLLVTVTVFLLSGMVETLQYVFCLGRCEVDDVIMNTLGAAVGASELFLKDINIEK